MEGFFIKGEKLYVVGGFDFQHGVGGVGAGDIFLNTDGGSITPYSRSQDNNAGINGNLDFKNSMDWDFVIDLAVADSGAMTLTGEKKSEFSIRSLTEDSWLKTVYYEQNDGANPYRYDESR